MIRWWQGGALEKSSYHLMMCFLSLSELNTSVFVARGDNNTDDC